MDIHATFGSLLCEKSVISSDPELTWRFKYKIKFLVHMDVVVVYDCVRAKTIAKFWTVSEEPFGRRETPWKTYPRRFFFYKYMAILLISKRVI